MSRSVRTSFRTSVRTLVSAAALLAGGACASNVPRQEMSAPMAKPDPRVGLKAGLMDAGEAIGNLKVTAQVPSPPGFLGVTNSDLTFVGNYAIQGNYNGPVIWDVSNPSSPKLVATYTCPASQNDVSVYGHLMFMSSEGTGSRLDCKPGGIADPVSAERMRGVRVFDISDIRNPKLVASVQTCRGSHTHTLLEDPKDKANVYLYVSGSAGTRSAEELPGCVGDAPDKDPNSTLMRIEVIKVPLAHPEQAAVVNRANIFAGLTYTPAHADAPEDAAAAAKAIADARAAGGFVARRPDGREVVVRSGFVDPQLDSIVKARGGSGRPTAADSAALRANLDRIIAPFYPPGPKAGAPIAVNRQCHDITVYPSLGIAGGACEGHGLLLDISDPVNPVRLDAVADSNFSYWHSATFNNDGTKLLFSDEWGGGGAPKCRATDKKEWGSDAIFTIVNRKLRFQSYYKLPAAQTDKENCVAHNGSLIPIPGRDVMVQAWYQGGISVFDWTDPAHPQEIAFFDRGPVDSTRMAMGGSWSAYWYNGKIVSSEIARGLDVAELVPSEYLTQNEIDAAKTVHWDQLNVQGQPKIAWPPSFALARAYTDQLERNKCLSADRIAAVRGELASAEKSSGQTRRQALATLTTQLEGDARSSCDAPKVQKLREAVSNLQNQIVP
ncbi:MAG TPA: hypothetical protein VG916_15105 [Gemmatimonadaceae bacterium]|nr:hypothetical protein [Gemmatimonadaceae bacterium]